MLNTIPADIVLDIIQYLDYHSVTSLERTCRYLRDIIETYGWKIFLRETSYYSPSLTPYIESSRCCNSRDLARQLVLAQQAWQERKFVARPLGPEWNKTFHPLLALHNRRLIVGAGNSIISYNFKSPSSSTETTRVCFERIISFPKDARKDITGVGFHNGGEDLILSFVHGGLARINVENVPTPKKKRSLAMKVPKLALVKDLSSSRIKDLSVCGDSALTIDSSGTLSLFSLEHARPEVMFTTNPFENTNISELGRRSGKTVAWSNYLSLTSSSSGYAVVGISSHTNPLSVLSISQSAIHNEAHAYLAPSASEADSFRSTAVYAITGSNNFNNLKNDTHDHLSFSDQVVLSGWYHGAITLHDLRCPTRRMHGHVKMLSPTLTLQDPLTFSPIYSLSMADYRIAAGSAQYSLLQLYDLRAPQSGFSVYLPRGRQHSSPVYSTVMESTRIWAGTESHAVVVDFGKTSNSTFPVVSERYTTGVKVKYDAPIYEHSDHRLRH